MILDSLSNSERYNKLHPLLEKAFDYIKSQDLAAMEIGKYEVSDGLRAIVSDKNGMTPAESIAKFECHNENIDIQLCIRGNEQMAWKNRKDCGSPKGEYNPEKDVMFYNDEPDTFFNLKPNQFTIFFPEDVHAPMIGEGMIKKLVVKIKI